MKKLIIAAVAGVLAVAANAKQTCVEETVCPFGYQIKIFVKTTGAGGVIAGDCKEAECLRVPATRRLAGFIYGATPYKEFGQCSETNAVCDCNMWNEGELLLWNYDTKKEAMPKKVELVQLDRIFTGDSTTVEMALKFTGWNYDFNLAGFGRVALRNKMWTLKFAQGFCAGVIPAPSCDKGCEDIVPANCWTICDSEKAEPIFQPFTTAAYGKWTLDWSATVYNRVATGASLRPGTAWDDVKEAAIKPTYGLTGYSIKGITPAN